MSEPKDFESTTQVLARRAPGLAWLPNFVRQKLTPAALWSAIVGLVTALVFSVVWLVRTQTAITDLQQEHDLLHKIDTQLAVMSTKVDTIAAEVDRQRQWRENIESVAESAPHSKRHK